MMDHLIPAHAEWHRQAAERSYPLALIDDLKAKARVEDLWNLFLQTYATMSRELA